MLFAVAHKAEGDVGMTTNATCDKSFDWMHNRLGMSPCLVAAQVMGACYAGNWHIPSLPSSAYYHPPNVTTANVCSCSYSAYNLLSACSTCQARAGTESSIISWAAHIQHCTQRQLSKIYFPESIPWNVSIPYWASIDPGTWGGRKFNVSNVRYLALEGESVADIIDAIITDYEGPPLGTPDLVPKTSDWQIPSTGPAQVPWTATAIVGGLLGALAGVMLLIDMALYLFYRQAKQQSRKHRSYVAQEKLKALASVYSSGA